VRVIETLPRGGAKTMNLAELDDEDENDEGACAHARARAPGLSVRGGRHWGGVTAPPLAA